MSVEGGTEAQVEPTPQSPSPGPEAEEQPEQSASPVKVVLVPVGHVITVAFSIGLSVQKLKCHLASELRVPVEVLQLSLNGTVLEEQQSLVELGIRPHSSTRMEMSSTKPDSHPLRPRPPPEHDSMPDVITVQVQTDEGQIKEVVVEIERPRQQMAFLGGFRHRLTGVEYHHAATQNIPKKRPDRGMDVFSREIQTTQWRSQAQQCQTEVSTQMTGIGCYVSCMKDKLITPRKYVTAEEYHARRLKAVIRLQSWARRWLAQQYVERLRQARNRRLAWIEMMEQKRIQEKEDELWDRRQRWMNPQKREDLNLLYQALQRWRMEEEQQINSTLQGAERKAALCSLSEQETQFIAAIGRHHIFIQNNNYDKFVRNFLEKSAAPLQWQAADGRMIEVDNPDTIRGRELRDLYNRVNQSAISHDQRLEVLMTLKNTVKQEHNGQLSRDILDLIDREVDLMSRGVRTRNLEGLRRRICTLFLQYIRTPAFNPIAEHLKVPQDPSQLKNSLFLCPQCQRYLRSKDFPLFAGVSQTSKCRACTELNNIAHSRVDLSCYKNILMRLRVDEQQINKECKIPFLLQVEDIQHLVMVIWGSQSALSASDDIYNLVFVRWERDKDWSPWNCILLSKEETSAHLSLDDVNKVYGESFIQEIKYKHSRARLHFSHMTKDLDPAPAAAPGNQVVSKQIVTAMGNHAADATQESAH
ncbi:IQ and ubiquitin-like domain-containing protein isoform X3 [Gouania willdenowi]|uniref:IQ and ubiquitin-like domain-containing protein isoform X3 n=1 Tax=Gouania willdenowi TaxID=441366 RepID=UPI00105465F2|nr:IQ and ubiquitin-like domain-containing protein isoform X3 [Gouania willdenowi]